MYYWLGVVPLNYPGCHSLCSLVARFIYSSCNSAIKAPMQIEIGPHRGARQLMNMSRWPRRDVLELSGPTLEAMLTLCSF